MVADHVWGSADSGAATASAQRISALDLVRLRDIAPLTITGRDYDAHRGAFRISPDARHIAFQLYQADPDTNRYDVGWYVSPISGGGMFRVADAGEVRLQASALGIVFGNVVATSDLKWSPDSRWIAYTALCNGETQLWRSSADGAKQEQLTRNPADVLDFEWSSDGRLLFFSTSKRTRDETKRSRFAEGRSGYLLDERFYLAYSTQPVYPLDQDFAGEAALRVYDFAQSQERPPRLDERDAYLRQTARPKALALEILRGAETPDLFLREQERREYKRLAANGLTPGVAAPAVFSRANRTKVAFSKIVSPRDRVSSPSSTVAVLLEGGSRSNITLVTCHALECTGGISHVWWSADGRQVYFRNADPVDEASVGVYAWIPGTDRIRKIFESTDELRDCSQAGNRLICIYSTPTQPRTIASLDLEKSQLTTLVDPNPGFRRFALTDVERLTWTENEYGTQAYGYLVKPAGYQQGAKYPLVIVTLNPEGFLRGGRGDEYPVHLFASEGFMVFVFQRSFKNLAKYGSAWRFSEGGIDRRQANASLEAGIQMLEDRGLIDPARIAVTGLSEGGAITYYALSRGKRRYTTGIVSTTDFEPIAYYLNLSPHLRAVEREAFGETFTKEGPRGGVYTVAPSQAADRIEAPLLFNLPDTEALTASQTMVTMAEYCKTYEGYVYPAEYHIKWQPAHRYAIYRRNIQWLKFWLQGQETTDPVDAHQYLRWRTMREKMRERFDPPRGLH
jgi:dipeptidyl aminopeptidase/acylaminoacyl peptidase